MGDSRRQSAIVGETLIERAACADVVHCGEEEHAGTHQERARPAMGVSQLPVPQSRVTTSLAVGRLWSSCASMIQVKSTLQVLALVVEALAYALSISLGPQASAIDQSIGRVFSEFPPRNHPLLYAPARFFRTALYLHPPLIRQLLRPLRSIPLQAVLLIANTAHGRLAEIASLASCARRASCRERCAQASVAVEA